MARSSSTHSGQALHQLGQACHILVVFLPQRLVPLLRHEGAWAQDHVDTPVYLSPHRVMSGKLSTEGALAPKLHKERETGRVYRSSLVNINGRSVKSNVFMRVSFPKVTSPPCCAYFFTEMRLRAQLETQRACFSSISISCCAVTFFDCCSASICVLPLLQSFARWLSFMHLLQIRVYLALQSFAHCLSAFALETCLSLPPVSVESR